MGHGGKRAGAGRKPGRKSGEAWKSKRPENLRAHARERVKQVIETARDPLTVLVEIADNPENPLDIRVEAAKSACPYVFPRLSATVVATAPITAKEDQRALVDRLTERFARLATPVPATIEASAEAA